MQIDTQRGPGRVEMLTRAAGRPRFLLVLTHGAGGGVDAPDLVAVRDAAVALGGAVAMVTQPYRLAGRAMPGSNTVAQDGAWCEIITGLRDEVGLSDAALVLGGRSNGARVACRTAAELRAAAVVAMAFPLHPPGKPERSRACELRETGVPTLVVNGDRDPFGVPESADATKLVALAGERHDLARNPGAVAGVVADWLGECFAVKPC